MRRVTWFTFLVCSMASHVVAQQPDGPKVIKGPIVSKPVRPSVSPSLREILRRQRARKATEKAETPERKVLNDYLSKYPVARSATLSPMDTKDLKELFPKAAFFSLRFRQYPVAIAPPKPLASNNVFVVLGKKVTHLSNSSALGKYFQENVKATDKEAQASSAALAFLRLDQELHQDGFYRFEKPKVKVSTAKGGFIARGEVAVEQKRGDRGSLTVQLSFLPGKLEKVTPGGKLSPGIRPRCQATRLLHPDPVIREIMRRDLIVLGSTARDYLSEQWEKAEPKLRKEIEAVWQQILREGR